jgi:phage terminase small subunit
MSINAKQRKFIDAYLLSMNATSAAKEAGYSKKTAYSIGQRLLKFEEIKIEVDQRLDSLHEQQKRSFIALSDSAIMALNDVVTNGRGLAKVNAANSILDRAGHKPVDRVQSDVNANVHADVNIEDAREELLEKLNRRYPIDGGEARENTVTEPKDSPSVTE